MATGHSTYDAELDHELASLLSVERFEPPAEFRQNALLSDPAIYEEAERDWQGWWARQAGSSTGSRRGTAYWTTPTRRSTSGSPAAS